MREAYLLRTRRLDAWSDSQDRIIADLQARGLQEFGAAIKKAGHSDDRVNPKETTVIFVFSLPCYFER